MYRIIDKRGTGKTSRLMLLAKENNGVLVCINPYATYEKAKAYGLIGFDIISYSEYIEQEYDMSKPCYIDDLEGFVKYVSGNALAGYSISED